MGLHDGVDTRGVPRCALGNRYALALDDVDHDDDDGGGGVAEKLRIDDCVAKFVCTACTLRLQRTVPVPRRLDRPGCTAGTRGPRLLWHCSDCRDLVGPLGGRARHGTRALRGA